MKNPNIKKPVSARRKSASRERERGTNKVAPSPRPIDGMSRTRMDFYKSDEVVMTLEAEKQDKEDQTAVETSSKEIAMRPRAIDKRRSTKRDDQIKHEDQQPSQEDENKSVIYS